ncbi:MAG: hypothetical protein COA78_15695 [Blastopirellula sp.]|nr:MAG: hypothetical protein COA78_15695 [Blastopirellula sp.]
MDVKRKPIKFDLNTTGTITLGAKSCLWFAWSPLGIAGPQGETVDGTYIPAEIDIEHAGVVTIEVEDDEELWSNRPENPVNADGRSRVLSLQVPAYQSSTYNSENISAISTNLCALVAMLGPSSTPSSTQTQKHIGLGPVTLTVGAGQTRLFLGFHDGQEWSNNTGSQTVKITIA